VTYNYKHMRRQSVNSIEVARKAGVSQATVSYVLNNREGQSISAQTRQKVLDAAQELKYRPNKLADGVLRRKTSTIALIASWLGSDFHSSVTKGVCEVLNADGYHTFVSWAKLDPPQQAAEVELLLQHRVEGIVYISDGNHPQEHAAAWLRPAVEEGIACAVIDDRSNGDFVDSIVSDDIAGARMAVEHLISLGHRRIGFWSAVWGSSTYGDRFEGYLQALRLAGIAVDTKLCAQFPTNARLTAIELHRFLAITDPPTAFFCGSDISAMIVRHAAEDTGLRVPDDLAIVGYSNQDYAAFNDLTSVSQNSAEIGRAAARLLLERLKHPERPPVVERVATDLVVRGSTVPQPKRSRFDWPDPGSGQA
jgi:LacI family transcriptional regulator